MLEVGFNLQGSGDMKKQITSLILSIFLLIPNAYSMNDLSWACGFQDSSQYCVEQFKVVAEESDNNNDILMSSDFGEDSSLEDNFDETTLIDGSGRDAEGRPRLNSNVIKIAAAAGALILVFPNDRAITDFVEENQNDVTEVAAFAGELLGSDIPIAAAGVGYIVGLVMKNNKIKKTSLLLGKSLLITGLLVQGLKRVFHRERPDSHGNSAYNFYGPSFSGDNLSFPSGHTMTAFTFATFIAEYTKHKSRVIPVLAYAGAALAGWSRVHDGAHWASDVIVGALVGHLVTKWILKKHTSKSGIMVSPYMSPEGGMMVGVSYVGKQISGQHEAEDSEEGNEFLFNEF